MGESSDAFLIYLQYTWGMWILCDRLNVKPLKYNGITIVYILMLNVHNKMLNSENIYWNNYYNIIIKKIRF